MNLHSAHSVRQNRVNGMDIILQILANGILTASLYALLAGGLSFLYSTTKIFHLAHGVVAVGASYAFWWLWIDLNSHPIVALIFAVLVAALAGFLMNELVYERLRRHGTKGLAYLIATLALLLLGIGIILALFGAAPKTFGLHTEVVTLGEINLTVLQIWIVIITAGLLGIFFWITKYTKFGKAMRATADNEIVAEVLGINTLKIRRLAFILVSVLAAAAGIANGLEFSLDPNRAVILAVFGFAGAVIGGVGNFGGAILASILMGFLEQGTVWFLGGGWRNAFIFILLFAFLLFKPEGLFGSKRVL